MAAFIDPEWLRTARPEIFAGLYNPKDLINKQVAELTRYCLPRLLKYEDRNSMAFGVEARVPHLAGNILDLVFTFPPWWKIRNGWTKFALREAMRGVLPPEILWNRVKKGYDVPQSAWVKATMPRISTWLESLPGDSLLAAEKIRSGLKSHQGGVYWFWRLISTTLWFHQYEVSV